MNKINANIQDIELSFETDKTVFSPQGIDKGTLAMLSYVKFEPDDKVLDLGCGYGVVGILAAKIIGSEHVVMSDINKKALQLAERNATENNVPDIEIVCSDGFSQITQSGFTKILSNPPYHTDFSVAKGFIEKGFNRLIMGGNFYMVTKRLDWYKNKLTAIFGGLRVYEAEGYFVFIAEKRSMHYANADSKTNKQKNKQKTKQKKK